ncbi:MAG TPA: hypothetical protein VKB56_11430 [Terriglobales bacterium]|nr:hypothetical protein [Terriglobales bacterium]
MFQRLLERCEAGLHFRTIHGQRREHADAPHPVSLLRARRERPRSRAAEQRDEGAAFQLIELHSISASHSRITGYRIGGKQSAD